MELRATSSVVGEFCNVKEERWRRRNVWKLSQVNITIRRTDDGSCSMQSCMQSWATLLYGKRPTDEKCWQMKWEEKKECDYSLLQEPLWWCRCGWNPIIESLHHCRSSFAVWNSRRCNMKEAIRSFLLEIPSTRNYIHLFNQQNRSHLNGFPFDFDNFACWLILIGFHSTLFARNRKEKRTFVKRLRRIIQKNAWWRNSHERLLLLLLLWQVTSNSKSFLIMN